MPGGRPVEAAKGSRGSTTTPETGCLVGAVPPAGITTQLQRSGFRAGATLLPSQGGGGGGWKVCVGGWGRLPESNHPATLDGAAVATSVC